MRGGPLGRRRGASLVEVLVSLTLLALGGGMATRLLMHVQLHLEGAELGLRAALLLAETRDGAVVEERPAGPGRLLLDGSADGEGIHIRFEPSSPDGGSPVAGPNGFRAPRVWVFGKGP